MPLTLPSPGVYDEPRRSELFTEPAASSAFHDRPPNPTVQRGPVFQFDLDEPQFVQQPGKGMGVEGEQVAAVTVELGAGVEPSPPATAASSRTSRFR